MNSVLVKRGFISILVVIACLVLGLWTYWTLQRNEVVKAAQSGLNTAFNTTVHINQVKLDDPGALSKWILLLFRKHDWFVIYDVPQQGNATSMGVVGQNVHGQWVYERTAPSGPRG